MATWWRKEERKKVVILGLFGADVEGRGRK